MKTLKTNAPKGNIFSEVVNISTPQARFDLSYFNKLTLNHGWLIPFLNQEIVPGDKFNVATLAQVRLQALIAPAMQDIDIEMRYFYVPYRLIWDNFEEFITGVGTHTHPYIEISTTNKASFDESTLSDYLGLNVNIDKITSGLKEKVSSLPFRAYQLIWNEYFRDENLQEEISFSKDDGIDDGNSYILRTVALAKDYFTSCLPWAQRGDAAEISADVILKDTSNLPIGRIGGVAWARADGTVVINPDGTPSTQTGAFGVLDGSSYNPGMQIDPNGTLGSLISINELRRANAVQRYLERSAIAGNRYSEWLLAHFGVKCADSRLQRPEYLGGGKCPVVISDIAQTSAAQLDSEGEAYDNSTPQGTLAGKGIASPLCSFNKPYFFPEYGVLLGLMYIRPKATYCQGVHRKWRREDRFDYYTPEFAYLGEQEVRKQEIYDDPSDGKNDETFGYQSRYAEYKFNSNELHGQFKSSLQFWTMPRKFTSRVNLNDSIIQANTMPYNIFAVTDSSVHHYIVEMYNKIDCVRPMPKLFTPKL